MRALPTSIESFSAALWYVTIRYIRSQSVFEFTPDCIFRAHHRSHTAAVMHESRDPKDPCIPPDVRGHTNWRHIKTACCIDNGGFNNLAISIYWEACQGSCIVKWRLILVEYLCIFFLLWTELLPFVYYQAGSYWFPSFVFITSSKADY